MTWISCRFVHLTCQMRRCDTLCTSGLTSYNYMYVHNGPYGHIDAAAASYVIVLSCAGYNHSLVCACNLWPWLGPPLAAFLYAICFRFRGWMTSHMHKMAGSWRHETAVYQIDSTRGNTGQERSLVSTTGLLIWCGVQLKRYKTYVRLLRVKTAAALREPDAKPVTTMIGELEGERPGNPVTSSAHQVTLRKTPLPGSWLADIQWHGWLGSRVVSVLDSGTEGPGFKSQLRRCRVTVLGKLLTPILPLFTKQQNW